MRKYFILLVIGFFLFLQTAYSQLVIQTWTENFDTTASISFSSTPSNGWKVNTNHYVSPPNSYRAIVPNMSGDYVMLQTPPYDLSQFGFISMRFKHICKVSLRDIVQIEYRTTGQTWMPIPIGTYDGNSLNFSTLNAFNAGSYVDWRVNDSTAIPDASWWKEEIFDLSGLVSFDPSVEFRFILRRGIAQGTQVNYGWLIDDFEISAATYQLEKPTVGFISYPHDTLYNVGPHIVNARVKTNTTARIENPFLIYTAINGTDTVTDTLLMTHVAGDSLWRVTIPQYVAGTKVSYSITGRDTTGNEAMVNSWYFIKQSGAGGVFVNDSILIGTSLGVGNAYHPFAINGSGTNWIRSLYMSSDIGNTSNRVNISAIAYHTLNTANVPRWGSECYLQSTTATALFTTSTLPNPIANGATRVYKGNWTTHAGWNVFVFDTPFTLPMDSNLLVTWLDTSSLNTCHSTSISWSQNTMPYVSLERRYSNTSNCSGGSGDVSSQLPSTVFYFGSGKAYGDNSVALYSIDNPTKTTVIGGVLNPIVITIQNKGNAILDSTTVYWQVNGGNIDSSVWRGRLPWDFKKQDTVGYFTAHADVHDTLKVWLAYPNGDMTDSVTWDDTLTITVYGCTQRLSGTKIISKTNGDFSSFAEVLRAIEDCGTAGNLILALDTGTYTENINLTNIRNSLGAYSLTITSLNGNAEDVIIRPTSGAAIVLNNSNNLTIQGITVDVSTLTVPAIQFTGACTNVVVRDCRLLGNPTTTTSSATNAPISKADGTGIVNNISFINNLINGGYYGWYFYGGTGANTYGNNVVFDSNTVSNQSNYAGHPYYVNLTSCSHNVFLSRTSNTAASWYGLRPYYVNGHIIGNRIIQRSTAITSPYGVYMYYYNYAATTDTGLFANNEIKLNTTSSYYGMYIGYSKTHIINNSIYVGGTGDAYGIYITNVNSYLNVKNNNIETKGASSYPIYIQTMPTSYQFDYNNMYAPTYIGFTGTAQSSLAGWQSAITTDINSVRIAPQFVDINNSLEVSNYADLLCNTISPINVDINGETRTSTTTIGCYESIPDATTNGMLGKLIGLRGGGIAGQTDNLQLIVHNTGTTPITSFNIEWSINGVPKVAGGTNYNISLSKGGFDTISIGSITYIAGTTDIKVWINNLNQGLAIDEFPKDDTLQTSTSICSTTLTGQISISATSTYTTIAEALTMGNLCGVTGDVTFILDAGVYNENINLTDISRIFGNYSLTITSLTGNAEDVIIRPTTGVGILLNNSNNLVIKAITVDAITSGTNAIQFTGACTNVVIRDCRLLASPTGTSTIAIPVYKASSTGVVDSIFFINNLIDGGYYGWYFYGGTGTNAYGTNIVFDSNTVSNQYAYAAYPYYVDFTSYSYNTILSRTSNISISWYGMFLYYSNGPTIGNRIIQRSVGITSPYPVYMYFYNYHATTDTGLFANNEIIMSAAGVNNGMYIDYTKAHIINNSIYVGGAGAAYGIYVGSGNSYMNVKNNNIAMEGIGAYPIYLGTISLLHQFDYNNMYAPTNVGYAGVAQTSITAWQSAVLSDKNSVRVLPNYIDNTKNLELKDYMSLYCPSNPLVNKDIRDSIRLTPTTIGCYEENLKDVNGALVKIVNLREGMVNGESDTIKVVFTNQGATPLNSVRLAWTLNGTSQTSFGEYIFNTPLTRLNSDTVNVGIITYSTGNYDVNIWIDRLNGGALSDKITANDTIRALGYVCSNTIGGLVSIGNTGSFPTLNAALSAIRICGVNNDIVLLLDSGLYEENCDLTNFNNAMNGYSLSIFSRTGKAEDVVIRPLSKEGFILNNSDNITIKDITIDATNGTYAIQFTGSCANVLIRDCRLLANPTTTSSSTAVVYKTSTAGIVNNISFINNLMDGGYYGFYFYGGIGSSAYGTNIVFDSNTVSNQHYYATYIYYIDFTSCSNNTILSRTSNTNTYWYGLYLYYSNATVIGNRIIQRSTAITNPYGAYMYYHNYHNTADLGLFANNEIILSASSASSYGIYVYYTKADVINNSVYVKGTGGASGIYVANPNDYLNVRNNNIVMNGSGAYPIYLNAITNLNRWSFDYNNMYAPTNVGYAGGARTTMTAWQTTVTTDKNSIRVLPVFTSNDTLIPTNYSNIQCIRNPLVKNDIRGNDRDILTAMGCYHGIVMMDSNATLVDVLGLTKGTISGKTDTLSVVFLNSGIATISSVEIEWSINNVSQGTKTVNYSPALSLNEYDTILLGEATYTLGNSDIKIWINELNGGMLGDEIPDDDTLAISVATCSNILSGTILVSDTGTYTSINQVLEALPICGATSDIVILLDSGVYKENVNLSNLEKMMNNYTLTITSVSGHADDVIIQPTSGVGITLSNTRNLILKDITVDATVTTGYAIQFTGACTNIVIRDCRLLASPTTSSSTAVPIYKASGTGIVDNISFINNLINGGYYGWYFYGGLGTSVYGKNVIFDSNTVSNQYYYATYPYYVDFTSCSHNTILSRTSSTNTNWYGLRLYYVNGTVIGNRVIQRSTAIANPYPVYMSYYNYYATTDTGLFANNEIIMSTSNAQSAMYVDYTRASLIHNSIYVGGRGAANGMYIDLNNNYLNIKNNNIVMESSVAYPIYLTSTSYFNRWLFDYNNMYAPSFVGYVGTGITSIASWQSVVPSDNNSVSISPRFQNQATDLSLFDYDGLECTALALVNTDILENNRNNTTVMGCYEQPDWTANGFLIKGFTANSFYLVGQTDTLKLVLKNTGNTTISTIDLEWSLNGVSKGNAAYATSLIKGAKDTIVLAPLTYTSSGQYDIKIWINQLNGGLLADDYPLDDTVNLSLFACSGGISGRFIIDSTSGNYQSLDEALIDLSNCIAGDVTLVLNPGTYRQNINLSNNTSYMKNYMLTIESSTHNAADVIIRPSTGAGITLSNTRNLILKDITVDATVTGGYAVQFTGACTNIVIRDCRLLASPTTTSTTSAPVYKAFGTGIVDSISFINNLMDGGYYGWYFYGGVGTSAYGTHIIFDSNTVSNQYYYATYPYYIDFISCSYNSFLSRSSNTNTNWYAFRPSYVNGDIIGNRIIQRSTAITYPYGVYMYYYNYYATTDTGLFANNEIIVSTSNANSGMYLYYTNANIINNSIYVKGSGESSGIFVSNSDYLNVKNNNIVMDGLNAYPIYIAAVSPSFQFDYNNMYAPNNVGYAGGTITSIAAWQQAITSDKNSVRILPKFMDKEKSLELSDYKDLSCPLNILATENINREARYNLTTIGAYGVGADEISDIEIVSITMESDNMSSLCLADYIPVDVEIHNKGMKTFNFATNPVTFNFSITGPGDFIPFDTIITLNTGTLEIFETKKVRLLDSLDIFNVGSYHVTVIINQSQDTIASNDTMSIVYNNTRIALPLKEEFDNGILAERFSSTGNATHRWTPVSKGLGKDTNFIPSTGTQMIAFGGSRGAMAYLSTKQIQLARTRLPQLEFWYFHDTIESEDYTDVRVTIDGTVTYDPVLSLVKQNATYGWTYYAVDLTPYTNGSCVSILFESMVKSVNIDESYQYIDKIQIISQPDLELSEIILDGISACTLGTNQLKIKRTTTTNQMFDFTKYSTAIRIEIKDQNNQPFYSYDHQLLDTIAGDTFDIITIVTDIPFVKGTYRVTAYLTNPIDEYSPNDTVKTTIVINPALSVTINKLSDCQNSFVAGNAEVEQTVLVTNTGNMVLSGIDLILNVHSNSYNFRTSGSFSDTLHPGDSKNYVFANKFIAPMDAEYHLDVVAYLSCDSALVNALSSETECVDDNDLYIVDIIHPTGTVEDKVGDVIKPIVSIGNHCFNDFDDVEITALIVDLEGTEQGKLEGTISRINMKDTLEYEFTNGYTVPAITDYKIIVYFKSVDNYIANDTMFTLRTTDHVGIKNINKLTISMEQNIPNPANNSTIIKYRVPNNGEVNFKIYSVSGQILYNNVENVQSGEHQIEINTSTFAAGIYFYTMEFEGQRITKRMSKQ